MNNEPEEIGQARQLLEEFEKAEGFSKKDSFDEAMSILNDFLAESPNSDFSTKANNIKRSYIKRLIHKLSLHEFTNLHEWGLARLWTLNLSDEIDRAVTNDPGLAKAYNAFAHKQPFKDEFVKYLNNTFPDNFHT